MAGIQSFDGVIFDMDGTLITPLLDFAAIRADIGIVSESGILEAIAAMPPDAQAAANEKLLGHELSAARNAELIPGAVEIVTACRAAGLKTALLTRNTRHAARIVMERFPAFEFDLIRCREDGIIKPQPDGVQHCCEFLKIAPAGTACIGDFHYDIIAANAAGAVSILLTTCPDWRDFAREADYVIDRLDELKGILQL